MVGRPHPISRVGRKWFVIFFILFDQAQNRVLEYDDQAHHLGIRHVPYKYPHIVTTINNDGEGKKW